MSEATGNNWRSWRSAVEFRQRRLARRTSIPRLGPSRWSAPPARDALNGNTNAPQAIGNGLAEIQPALTPGVVWLGRAGGAEDVHSPGFEHLFDAVDVVTVAHYDARFQ